MSEAGSSSVRKPRRGFFGFVFALPFQILGVVVLSLLTSVLIEWAGMYWHWWSLPGAEHAKQTMESEMRWLDQSFTRSLVLKDPIESSAQLMSRAYEFIVLKTGIAPMMSQPSVGWIAYLQAAVYVSLMTFIRLIILVLTIPLFVMAALVGFVDGLVQRDLRRFGAGRESAFLYHHAKRAIGPTFIIGWLIYLSLPIALHPNWFLLPNAFLFGVMIAIASRSFKKYL